MKQGCPAGLCKLDQTHRALACRYVGGDRCSDGRTALLAEHCCGETSDGLYVLDLYWQTLPLILMVGQCAK